MKERQAKRQKCDTDIPRAETTAKWASGSVDDWGAAAVLGSGWGRDIPRIETTDTWASGSVDDWGAAAVLGSGWGRDIPRTETTDTWASSSVDDWGAAAVLGSGWGQASDENPGWASLQFDEPKSLIYLLGPTVLPLTHSPGIVERSMRRIVSITRPPPSAAKSLPLPEGIYHPNADAVELELDFRFTKVVLAPMIDWDGGESPVYTKPLILKTSLGAVVGQDDHHTPMSPTRPQPYNPETDEITLLIEDIASQIDFLREGMAIGGTWVQLVRQGDPVVAAKKKGGKSLKSGFWYLDEFALVVPSFWTIVDDC